MPTDQQPTDPGGRNRPGLLLTAAVELAFGFTRPTLAALHAGDDHLGVKLNTRPEILITLTAPMFIGSAIALLITLGPLALQPPLSLL